MMVLSTVRTIGLIAVLAMILARTYASPSDGLATEIVEKSHKAFYYAGADIKVKVTMDLITKSSKKHTRVLTMLRWNVPDSSQQKYFLYFHSPGDVRRVAFLVWKYPEQDDDRWIFIPAMNMVRRIAASDSRSSFVGSDFTYEDVSGRDLSADEHTLLREEKLGSTLYYVIQSIPKTSADFIRKIAWLEKETFLPRREEYYDAQGELARVFTADKIAKITAGDKLYPTITKRTMNNVKSGHRTEVTFHSIEYDIGLEDSVFTERSLKNPPKKWVQ